MNSDARPPSPADLIMNLGADARAATALASACGLPLLAYDPAELTAALGAGQRCVVVWPDPHTAIAEALRNRSAPSVGAAAWLRSSRALLDLFARNRRKLLLIAASLISQGRPDDLDRLAARLALSAPLTLPSHADPDFPAMLARFVGAHLSDLRPVWQELQGNSLAPPEDSPHSTDLDPLAQLVAAQQAATERDAADEHRLSRLDQERHLMRDQLAEVTVLLTEETATHHISQQRAELTLQEERTARQQSEARSALAAQAKHQDATEVGLLRDQLVCVTALMQEPSSGPSSLGAAHVLIESAFATLLSDLATETDLRRTAQLHTITTAEALRNTPRHWQSVPNRPGT